MRHLTVTVASLAAGAALFCAPSPAAADGPTLRVSARDCINGGGYVSYPPWGPAVCIGGAHSGEPVYG